MKSKSVKKTTDKKAVTKKVAVQKVAKCEAKKPTPKKAVAKSVTFTLHADKGKAVYLAGEFNAWDPTVKKMSYKAASGIYAATIKLAPGTYQYKFVLDGAWCADPENVNAVANDHGTFNSIITVK